MPQQLPVPAAQPLNHSAVQSYHRSRYNQYILAFFDLWCDAYCFSESFSKSHMHIYSYIALLIHIYSTWIYYISNMIAYSWRTHTWLIARYMSSPFTDACVQKTMVTTSVSVTMHRGRVQPMWILWPKCLTSAWAFQLQGLGGTIIRGSIPIHSLLKINGWNTSIIIPSRWGLVGWLEDHFPYPKNMGWWL